MALANEYLRAGIKYLPTDKALRWQSSNYQLFLDLHNCLLQSEASFGHYEEAEKIITEVLENAANDGDLCARQVAEIRTELEALGAAAGE